MEQINLFDELYPKYVLNENKKTRLITLFSGYDSQKLAFNYLGKEVEHYRVCEFDKYAINTLNEIHNTNFETTDIKSIKGENLGIVEKDKYNYIMTYSFPCTDLSLAGKRQGMERGSGTRSGLLWEVERILKETKELPDVLIMENVPQVLKANGWYEWCEFLESLGYKNYAEVINAKRFGIPQNRERCFMVSILGDYSYNFPKGFELKYRLKDLLEENVDEKYYLSDKMISYISASNQKWTGNNNGAFINKDVASTLNTGEGSRRCDASNYVSNDLPDNFDLQDIRKCRVFDNDRKTKKGYQESYEGDSINLQSMDTQCEQGVAVKVPLKRGYSVEVRHELFDTTEIDIIGNYSKSDYNATPIVGKNGVAPTVRENHGQVTAITTKNKTSIEMTQELLDDVKNGKYDSNVAYGKYLFQSSRFKDEPLKEMSQTIKASKVDSGVIYNLRIRKLTPRECFRLMGVKDTDYNKITCSNAQKYKQAGNSIVTTCLMAIYSQLYKDCDYKSKIDDLLKELTTSNDNNKQINK